MICTVQIVFVGWDLCDKTLTRMLANVGSVWHRSCAYVCLLWRDLCNTQLLRNVSWRQIGRIYIIYMIYTIEVI